MWPWKKKPETDAALRDELLEARAKVEYQLSIMKAGPASHGMRGWRERYKENVAQLTETLRQIDESLASLPAPEDHTRR